MSDTDRKTLVSLVPYGLDRQHLNAYTEILNTLCENRDNLGVRVADSARRLLRRSILLPAGRWDASGVPDDSTAVAAVPGAIWREQRISKTHASGSK